MPYEVKFSGPQRDIALAGLPYEVKSSGPQRDIALAGLPYEVKFSVEEKRRQRGRKARKERRKEAGSTSKI